MRVRGLGTQAVFAPRHAEFAPAACVLCSYASFLAASHNPRQAATVWLTYWVLFALVCQAELMLEPLISWCALPPVLPTRQVLFAVFARSSLNDGVRDRHRIPAFGMIKLAGVLWLTLPQTRGAALIYSLHVAPVFDKLAENKKRAPQQKGAGGKPHVPTQPPPFDHAEEVLNKAATFLKVRGRSLVFRLGTAGDA